MRVETFKPSSKHESRPLALTLRGPRNYLLTERSDRRTRGTRISVVLRKPLEFDQPEQTSSVKNLTELVSEWCRRVEFPVVVTEFGNATTITAETSEDFTYEMPVVGREGARFILRAFPTNCPGIEGEFYVLAYADGAGESWAEKSWAQFIYPKGSPQAASPPLVNNLTCMHGISSDPSYYDPGFYRESLTARLDFRLAQRQVHITMGRVGGVGWNENPQLTERVAEIIAAHLQHTPLASAQDAWRYKQRLVSQFDVGYFWDSAPEMIPLYDRGEFRPASLNDVLALPVIRVVSRGTLVSGESTDSAGLAEGFCLLLEDIGGLSDRHRTRVFGQRQIASVTRPASSYVAIIWESSEAVAEAFLNRTPSSVVALGDPGVIGCPLHKTTESTLEHLILNSDHQFVQWLIRAKKACAEESYGLTSDQFDRLTVLVDNPLRFEGHELDRLQAYLEGWSRIPNLPADLHPPTLAADPDLFKIKGLPDFDERYRSTYPSGETG